MGKGSNAIVSMLHRYFSHHGLGEKTAHLHADNCGGQNKNATMVHYLIWRVMVMRLAPIAVIRYVSLAIRYEV